MAKLCWTQLEVMQEHLQNLMSDRYMRAVELATYRVPKDPAPPAPAGRYVMVCMVFYE
jgi:hypothetical protein